MNCPECGAHNPDSAEFCQYCKAKMVNISSFEKEEQEERDKYTGHAMGWYKFLIYFALFAGAIMNLINGIIFVTGSQYGGRKEAVYAFFGGLKTIDVIMGIICFVLCVYAIITRVMLAGLKKAGPPMLYGFYIINIVSMILYYVFAFIILAPSGAGFGDLVDFRTIVSFIVPVVMLFVNISYFNYRKNLFVN